jgi:signal transduction histidine kinase
MRLGAFIRDNKTLLISQWEQFARTLAPAADNMGPLALRDHIKDILEFIANDIESPQTDAEQIAKSHGEKKASKLSPAEVHAALRQNGGFNLNQMVSEFRALRASVTKLWCAQLPETIDQSVSDLTRFNESVDQALTEGISYYSKAREHSRDLFLAILGHDLRNPIGSMLMSAQLTSHIGALNERQMMLNSQIIASAGRATEILDHLLDLTRARLGSGLGVIKGPMDMTFVSRQLVDEMRAMHPGRVFTLETAGNTEGHWDRPRIGQVLSNLLGNAIQYGFTDLPINVEIKGETEIVSVCVHNDGVPIPAGAIGRIFESLARAQPDNAELEKSTNLGLGLYITKEIVCAHGGTIGVTSSEKDGTTFTARFPRASQQA